MYVEIDNAIATNDVAIVELRFVYDNDKVYYAEGWSKRDPMDRPDRDLALRLAMGRALENLSKRVMREANGLIKHHDDTRAQKPEQIRKSKEWHKKQTKKNSAIARAVSKKPAKKVSA